MRVDNYILYQVVASLAAATPAVISLLKKINLVSEKLAIPDWEMCSFVGKENQKQFIFITTIEVYWFNFLALYHGVFQRDLDQRSANHCLLPLFGAYVCEK